MKLTNSEIETLVYRGAERALARAAETHSISADCLARRIRTAVDKYLLRTNDEADAQDVSRFIDSIQVNDLCLILACESGDQVAWDELVQRFSSTVRSAARSASSGEDAAEDLAQSIWAELYGLRTRADGRPGGKLAYYSGSGSLAGWLRAVVAQLAVDEHRKQSRMAQAEEDNDLERLAREASLNGNFFAASTVANPEHDVSRKLASSQIQDALMSSIEELAAEDRLLVKLYYFDNLRLREAGGVLGVHEATASRRLSKIHSQLRQRVSAILIRKQGWSNAEVEQGFREVAVNLQTDVEGILKGETLRDVESAKSTG